GPLHALWTLHGLGQLDGSNQQALQAAVGALRHPVASVRKAALQVLPQSAFAENVQSAGLLQDADPYTRLAAVLRLAELPESDEIGRQLYQLSQDQAVTNDRWLADAAYVAAAKHRRGFFAAHTEAVGEAQFRSLAERLAVEAATPPTPPQQQQWPPRDPEASSRPVAERLLLAYVEEHVGPIERPTFAGNRGGQGANSDLP